MKIKVQSGKYKNRTLFPLPRGEGIRMTTGIVKKAIIDIFRKFISGAKVLDLFAGSGNMGIEFISNNAESVIFIEKSKRHCEIIKKNLNKCGIDKSKYKILNTDVIKGIRLLGTEEYKFDFIFIDPPYFSDFIEKAIEAISEVKIYHDDTVIIAEHHKKEKILSQIGEFEIFDERRYGPSVIKFYRSKNFRLD